MWFGLSSGTIDSDKSLPPCAVRSPTRLAYAVGSPVRRYRRAARTKDLGVEIVRGGAQPGALSVLRREDGLGVAQAGATLMNNYDRDYCSTGHKALCPVSPAALCPVSSATGDSGQTTLSC